MRFLRLPAVIAL